MVTVPATIPATGGRGGKPTSPLKEERHRSRETINQPRTAAMLTIDRSLLVASRYRSLDSEL